MALSRTAAEIARSVGDELERQGFRYAIGGALALGFYAPPRATVDVDLNIFVSPDRELDGALDALRAAGFVAEKQAQDLERQACSEGQFRGFIDGMRIDVFVPAIPYYARLADRRRQVPLLGRPIWILGAEDLVVLKLMFHRRKDIADIEALLDEQGSTLDREYIRRTLLELVDGEDERLTTLQAIENDVDRRRE
jgi:hypothetical protein